MRAGLRATPSLYLRPIQIVRRYHVADLRPDLVAGLTAAIISIPQAIAYVPVAESPPDGLVRSLSERVALPAS